MFNWMKRVIAAGVMALAVTTTTGALVAPAYAADDKKPAVTAPAAAPAAAAAPAEPAPTPNKADTTWMMVSTALVMLMTLPGLALFYGGLTRSKNVLSILMQCMVVFSLIAVLWAVYGYSFAFTEGSAFFGGLDRSKLRRSARATVIVLHEPLRYLEIQSDARQPSLHPFENVYEVARPSER